MKSLENKVSKEAPAPENKGGAALTEEEELDLEICVAMAKKLLMEGGGLKVIVDAIKTSQDPTAVIGQFFAQMFAQMQEKFPEELEISPKVYLCRGGVLEQMLDYLEEVIGLPKNWSDKVFDATVETIKAAAAGSRKGAEAPAQEAPAPEQAMPQAAPAPVQVAQ